MNRIIKHSSLVSIAPYIRYEWRRLRSSILDYPHKTLDPSIWNIQEEGDPKILPQLKTEIFNRLFEKLEQDFKGNPNDYIQDIFIIGSETGYKYKKTSDIDVTIKIDWDKFLELNDYESAEEAREDLVASILEINGEPFEGTQHPINYYILPPDRMEVIADAVYSLTTDTWIKTVQAPIKEDFSKVWEYLRTWAEKLDLAKGELGRDLIDVRDLQEYMSELDEEERKQWQKKLEDKMEEVIGDMRMLVQDYKTIHQMRKKEFEEKGIEAQYSMENILYKYLEKYEYLDFLKSVYKLYKEIMEEKENEEKKKQEEVSV